MLEEPHNAKYFAKNKTIINNNRIHIVVLRLQSNMIIFLIKSLNCGRIFHKGHNNITILSSFLLLNYNCITIKYSYGGQGCCWTAFTCSPEC